MPTTNDRVLALLAAGASLDVVCEAMGIAESGVIDVAQTYQVASQRQRAYDLLSVGHSVDDVSVLLAMPAYEVPAVAQDLTMSQTPGFSPGSSSLDGGIVE